jgi:hypothetical protein
MKLQYQGGSYYYTICNRPDSRKTERSHSFYYNGYGVPKPTASGELWCFNRTYAQYIPVSIQEAQDWLGSPGTYVWDCSAAHQQKRHHRRSTTNDHNRNIPPPWTATKTERRTVRQGQGAVKVWGGTKGFKLATATGARDATRFVPQVCFFFFLFCFTYRYTMNNVGNERTAAITTTPSRHHHGSTTNDHNRNTSPPWTATTTTDRQTATTTERRTVRQGQMRRNKRISDNNGASRRVASRAPGLFFLLFILLY